MRDSYVDWLHDLPFHEYNAEHWTRSVVHISLVYVIPWLTLFVITAVAWSQYHVRACLWPETPLPSRSSPRCSPRCSRCGWWPRSSPPRASHYHDGFQTTATSSATSSASSRTRATPSSPTASPSRRSRTASSASPRTTRRTSRSRFKLQRARVAAAERALISDEDTEHIVDLVATLRYDTPTRLSRCRRLLRRHVDRLRRRRAAPSRRRAAASAPDDAAGVRRGFTSSARRDAVLSVLNDVPFVALLYIWLVLAAMAPVNVIAAESCYDWASVDDGGARADAREVLDGAAADDDAGAHEIPNVGQRAFSTSGARTTRR